MEVKKHLPYLRMCRFYFKVQISLQMIYCKIVSRYFQKLLTLKLDTKALAPNKINKGNTAFISKLMLYVLCMSSGDLPYFELQGNFLLVKQKTLTNKTLFLSFWF